MPFVPFTKDQAFMIQSHENVIDPNKTYTAYADTWTSTGQFSGWAIGYGNQTVKDPITGELRPTQPTDSFTGQYLIDMSTDQINTVYGPATAAAYEAATGANWADLSPGSQAALTDISYNYGTGFMNGNTMKSVYGDLAAGNTDAAADKVQALSANPNIRAYDAEAIRTGQPGTWKGGGGGGAGPASRANGVGGASFGGAGCAGGGMSAPAAAAAASLAQGAGMAPNAAMSAMNKAMSATPLTGAMGSTLAKAANLVSGGIGQATGALGAVMGAVSGGPAGILTTLGGTAMGALSQVGSGILPSLTGVLPQGLTGIASGALVGALTKGPSGILTGAIGGAIATSGLGQVIGGVGNMIGSLSGVLNLASSAKSSFGNGMTQWAATGGLSGMISTVSTNIVGNKTGDLNNFMNAMTYASALSGIANNVVGAAAEASALRFGNGVNGLGSNFRNNNDVISFGITTLGRNLPAVSSDLINLGKLPVTDLLRLNQPGSIAKILLCSGYGGYTGLVGKLIDNNISVAGLDSPLNDDQIQIILNNINDPTVVTTITVRYGIRIKLDNLGQLTDLSYMCPHIYTNSPSKSFKDLGEHLISLGITEAKTFAQIGEAIAKVDPGLDLNSISQMSTPFNPNAAKQLMQTYGYGGGSIGEITMADFIGTAAGYVHNDTMPTIIKANHKIMETPEGQELSNRIQILNNLIDGKYHVPGHAAGSNGEPAIPDRIIIQSTVNDYYQGKYRGTRTFGGGINGVYYSLDEAVAACVQNIENQMQVIKNHPDPEIQKNLEASEKAHAASCAQILKENHLMKQFKMNLFEKNAVSPALNAYTFASGLQYAGQNVGYGQMGDFLERVTTDDIHGDTIRAAMRMGRNEEVLRDLGVNVDRFKLPHSQYYRDPTQFYKNAYTGNMPTIPENLLDRIIPATPADTYVDLRNQVLRDYGYDPSKMLPAQADETYYDLQWQDCGSASKEGIGLGVLSKVLDRNVRFQGRKGYLTTLRRGRIHFCDIEDNGLMLYDGDDFIASLLAIINKVLYGNIGATKFENPFDTDKMVYGAYEMLGQITPQNIDALMATKLGSMGMKGMLSNIRTLYINMTNEGETSINRNETSGWGGSGPDGDTIIPPERKKV